MKSNCCHGTVRLNSPNNESATRFYICDVCEKACDAIANDCGWADNEDGAWETSCGEIFEFTNRGPHQNRFTFCPFCGLKIITTKITQ